MDIQLVDEETLPQAIFYAQKDHLRNLMILGDLHPPFFEHCDIYAAVEDEVIQGLASVLYIWDLTSIVVCGDKKVQKKLLAHALKQKPIKKFFTICEPDEVNIFKGVGKIVERHHEEHMILRYERKLKGEVLSMMARPEHYKEIDEFYRAHPDEAPAWHTLHLDVGPHYFIRSKGKIASVAGVHFKTLQIGQIGNLVTAEEHRGKGFATDCCRAVAQDLARECNTVSLFVEKGNVPALKIYTGLGFEKIRELEFITVEVE